MGNVGAISNTPYTGPADATNIEQTWSKLHGDTQAGSVDSYQKIQKDDKLTSLPYIKDLAYETKEINGDKSQFENALASALDGAGVTGRDLQDAVSAGDGYFDGLIESTNDDAKKVESF